MTTVRDLYGDNPPDPVRCPVCETEHLHPETGDCPDCGPVTDTRLAEAVNAMTSRDLSAFVAGMAFGSPKVNVAEVEMLLQPWIGENA